MQIVTDTGVDLVPADRNRLNIHVIPHKIFIGNETYLSGVDLDIKSFYQKLDGGDMPKTAPPEVETFTEMYRRLAQTEPDILSIHMSSGLSDTVLLAREAAKLVPEARITVIDTRSVSVGAAWQVLAGAKAARAGWDVDDIIRLLQTIGDNTQTIYTVKSLRYLRHGGRISHIQGLMAGMLDIKPLIGVNKESGKYEQIGRVRSLRETAMQMVEQMLKTAEAGSRMRVQIVHGDVPEIVQMFKMPLSTKFKCEFMPTVQLAPVLAAHAGPTAAGFAYGPADVFRQVPDG